MRLRTGFAELDRVLGGGMVSGALMLLGGDPGVGKSTLLLATLVRLANKGLPALYVTGEESSNQVRIRAERLGLDTDSLYLLATTDMDAVDAALSSVKPRFLVLDSIQVLRSPGLESSPGSVLQVRAVADRALTIAKRLDVATILVGHVTREGTLAGPRVLEHLVDTVIYFECDGRSPLRLLRAVKNRFGPTGELGIFEMTEAGLVQVPDPSARLLAEREPDAAGTAVVAGMEGTRPLLTEVQALVGRVVPGNPTRTALGLDRARVNLLLAVMDKAGLSLAERDVYVNAAGGVKLHEPAADLGLAAALASSLRNRPIRPDTVLFGEVGLTGEVRGVSYSALRLKEAWRHGFRRAIIPRAAAADAPGGMETTGVRRLREVLDLLRQES